MDSRNQAISALNLSYVLHEPSTSVVVRDACSKLQVENRRCTRAIRQLASQSDLQLARQLLVRDERSLTALSDSTSSQVVSVRVGAWEMLPRLLRVAGIVAPGTRLDVAFLDDPDKDSLQSFPLFGGIAALNLPAGKHPGDDAYLFASAVFRPGYKSILLRFNTLDADFDETATDNPLWQIATSLAEAAVREFVYQWSCPRALWDRPAEEALPEFESLGNGTIECGR